jgi:hypothetical protein
MTSAAFAANPPAETQLTASAVSQNSGGSIPTLSAHGMSSRRTSPVVFMQRMLNRTRCAVDVSGSGSSAMCRGMSATGFATWNTALPAVVFRPVIANGSFTSTPAARGARASRSDCIHRIQLAARSDRHERPARRFIIYADSAPPHKMLSARAAAGVRRATMSALIVIFVFVIFQFLATSRPAFQAP